MSRTAAVLAITVAALLASAVAMAQKVYRWVDEEGRIHYTEALPPDFKDKGHDILSESGIVTDENQKLTPEAPPEEETEQQAEAEELGELPRDSSGLPRPKPLYSEAERQAKMDSFLTLRYKSEEEITEARDVEIKQLNYDRRLLEGSRDSMNDSYRGQIRVAANKQRAGLAVSEDVRYQIADLQQNLAENADELSKLDQREQTIRTGFQEELDRYRYLVEKYKEEDSR
ncbi:MAG: DUF4124 domain-containing protein [Xanthomonadales bacterium]|nr:DUF4124 domain-containing protein [Xanthomonadales bacterium]